MTQQQSHIAITFASHFGALPALARHLCWDEVLRSNREYLLKNKPFHEQNRLTTVRDQSNLSSYIYNSGGQRVWKLTGAVERMQINGSQYIDQVNINQKTLYASPYLVVSDQEYSKHYYAGSQRLASKLSAGLVGSVVDPLNYQVQPINSTYQDKADSLYQMLERGWQCSGIDAGNVSLDPELPSIQNLYSASANEPENERYFYHSDHLGSSSWITDASGSVNQHLQYLPFGESFIDQRVTGHDVRFKFTGKERDAETGYDYFGARYYDSELSVWLSVDPLAGKYPSMSAYMYVGGHPTMITDPNGMDWYRDKNGNYVFDKNVTKDTKLAKGEKYLGETSKINVTKGGKYAYSYNLNKDGSFSDTRGNSYEAGSGEFDLGFLSGHKINNNSNKYPSFGGVMFYKEDGTFLFASGMGDKDVIYTIPDDKVNTVMKKIKAFDRKSNSTNYFQHIANQFSSNTYNTWVLNGRLWVYKTPPWYMCFGIALAGGVQGYSLKRFVKNDGLEHHYSQSADMGIDGFLHNKYDPKEFDTWW